MDPMPTEADLAVLDAALEEELELVEPPDLWPRLQAARVAAAARRPLRRRQFAAAAAVLLGTALVVSVLYTRSAPPDQAPAVPAAGDQGTDPDGPRSLAELQQWLGERGLRTVGVKALVVRVPAGVAPFLGDQVREVRGDRGAAVTVLPLWSQPLEELKTLFRSLPTLRLQVRDDLEDALQRARPAAVAPVAARCWEHAMQLDLLRRNVRLLVAGRLFGAAEFAVAGPDGPWGIELDPAVAAALGERLDAATAQELAGRGLALGDDGLRALPDDATRLDPVGTSAAAVAGIGRFTAVRHVDLRAAPAWHDAAVLRQLAQALPVRDLLLDGSQLDRAGVAALAGFTALTEFYAMAPGPWAVPPPARLSPVLDDAAMATLAQLPELREVMLGGAALTDAGVAALAALPKLRSLSLVQCPALRGSGLGAFADRDLEHLALSDCPRLDAAGIGAIAAVKALRELTLGGDVGAAALEPLTGLPVLERLALLGRGANADLGAIAAMPALRHLTLRPERTFALGALHDARQLERIELVVGADAAPPAASAVDALRAALPDCNVGVDRW